MRFARGTGPSIPPTRYRLGPYVIVVIIAALALAGIDALALAAENPSQVLSRHYYLALGDSIAYGYQPNANFTDGYVDDVFNDLKGANVSHVVNFGCPSESSSTFINGSCPDRYIKHDQYIGSQLSAAVNFLKSRQGQVDPVTLDLGANDVINDFDESTCTASTSAQADIAAFDANMTQTILPQLTSAYTTMTGAHTGEFVILNYYDPYAKSCPSSLALIEELNQHIAADAAKFNIKVADVFRAFGGTANMATNICTLTWMCDPQFHDIHPTTKGYAVMAGAVEQALSLPGIGPGANPLSPGLPFQLFGADVAPWSGVTRSALTAGSGQHA